MRKNPLLALVTNPGSQITKRFATKREAMIAGRALAARGCKVNGKPVDGVWEIRANPSAKYHEGEAARERDQLARSANRDEMHYRTGRMHAHEDSAKEALARKWKGCQTNPSSLQAWDLGVVRRGVFHPLGRTHSRAKVKRWLDQECYKTGETTAAFERWDDGCSEGAAHTVSGKEVPLRPRWNPGADSPDAPVSFRQRENLLNDEERALRRRLERLARRKFGLIVPAGIVEDVKRQDRARAQADLERLSEIQAERGAMYRDARQSPRANPGSEYHKARFQEEKGTRDADLGRAEGARREGAWAAAEDLERQAAIHDYAAGREFDSMVESSRLALAEKIGSAGMTANPLSYSPSAPAPRYFVEFWQGPAGTTVRKSFATLEEAKAFAAAGSAYNYTIYDEQGRVAYDADKTRYLAETKRLARGNPMLPGAPEVESIEVVAGSQPHQALLASGYRQVGTSGRYAIMRKNPRSHYRSGREIGLKETGCDGCSPSMIQGHLCHETGCPEAWRDSTKKCFECGCDFYPESRWQRTCPDCARGYDENPGVTRQDVRARLERAFSPYVAFKYRQGLFHAYRPEDRRLLRQVGVSDPYVLSEDQYNKVAARLSDLGCSTEVVQENPGARDPRKPCFGPGRCEYRRVFTNTEKGLREAERLHEQGWYQAHVGLNYIDFYREKRRNPGIDPVSGAHMAGDAARRALEDRRRGRPVDKSERFGKLYDAALRRRGHRKNPSADEAAKLAQIKGYEPWMLDKPGFVETLKRYIKFHGCWPTSISKRQIKAMGDPQQVEFFMNMGKAPDVSYIPTEDQKNSNKAGSAWLHEFNEGGDPKDMKALPDRLCTGDGKTIITHGGKFAVEDWVRK